MHQTGGLHSIVLVDLQTSVLLISPSIRRIEKIEQSQQVNLILFGFGWVIYCRIVVCCLRFRYSFCRQHVIIMSFLRKALEIHLS